MKGGEEDADVPLTLVSVSRNSLGQNLPVGSL